jgi:hypothetical protein
MPLKRKKPDRRRRLAAERSSVGFQPATHPAPSAVSSPVENLRYGRPGFNLRHGSRLILSRRRGTAAGITCEPKANQEHTQVKNLCYEGLRGAARGCPCPGAGVADERSHGWRSEVSIERAKAWKAEASVRRRARAAPSLVSTRGSRVVTHEPSYRPALSCSTSASSFLIHSSIS